jgi:hypothetical protein
MTAISQIERYGINGVVDTAKPVWKNIENIANSCNTWVTYDVSSGKWSLVINKAESSSHSFNDSNIIGAVDVSGSGLDSLANSVEVTYPSKDLDDSADFVRIDLPSGDRKPNEPDNMLKLNYPLINDTITATVVGLLELKQSRVDLVVSFTTDYSKNDVNAGDVIDITNTTYGWTNKLFRVLQIEEVDGGDGTIQIKITGLEYDANVYDTGDLERFGRSNADGVITAGAIGTMATPTVTKTEVDRKPFILIESTVPDNTDPNNQAGLVNGVEVWYYPIPAAELPTWETVDDEARTYQLHSTVASKSTTGFFAPGEEIDYYISDFNEDNFLVKLRAVNGTTQGPFSTRSGLIDYQPKQTTDNITNDTEVDDGSGNILTSLGLSALIGFLNSMMRDNAGGAGSLFEKIFDIFQTEEGFDVASPSIKKLGLNPNGSPMIIAHTDSSNIPNIRQSTSTSDFVIIYNSVNFSPDVSGTYKVDAIYDQNSSGANGGRGSDWSEDEDNIGFVIDVVDNVSGTSVYSEGTGGYGAFYWTDFVTSGLVTLDSARTYKVTIQMLNYTESDPSATADVTIGYNIYTV